MNGEPRAMTSRRFDHIDAILPARRERFLHHCCDLALRRKRCKRLVASHARRYVDKVDRNRVEHRLRIGKGRNAKHFSRCRDPLRILVANGNELCAVLSQVSPGMQMVSGIKTAPDQSDLDTLFPDML